LTTITSGPDEDRSATPAASVTPGGPSTDASWFGHPRQLARLFTTEMWERFGYYGMRALLVLYLTKHFLFTDTQAAVLYGGYTALVYLTPLIGGLIADQFLGAKRSVKFGALIMAVGYFTLAFTGGPAKPYALVDGHRAEIQVQNFRDGPTSDPRETRLLLLDGHRYQMRGNDDGSISLLENGAEGRRLAPGQLKAKGEQSPLYLSILLVALSLISVGNGFFKPNIATIVGALYGQADSRRDAGFTIFYMGLNLGSIFGQLMCPLLADWIGWPAGLGLAGFGMLFSWVLMHFDGGRLSGYGETPERAGGDRAMTIYIGALIAVPVIYFLFRNLLAAPPAEAGTGFWGALVAMPLLNKLLYATFAISVPAILAWAWRAGSRAEFEMMIAAMLLITFNVVFWTLFEQAGSSLTLFADRNTDRSVFGLFTMSAPQTQNFNPLTIVFFAPVMSALWAWLARRGREPSIPVKFGLALIGVGAGFLFLVLGSTFAGPDFRVGLWWLAGLYFIHSIAELCISPVGLSMITKLSLARIVGLMMGVWYLSLSLGQSLAGLLAQEASVETVGGQVANLKLSLDTYVGIYQKYGWLTVAIGVVLLLLARPLQRLMHGVK
jgi:POT family proton-dependent oligopeptide transporter